jgi:hypothetical protein
MKIDFSYILKDMTGADIKQPRPLSLSEVSAGALLGTYDDDKNSSAESKIQRYKLAHKMFTKDEEGKQVSVGELDITPEEAVLIKKYVNKAYAVLIVGQVDELIK